MSSRLKHNLKKLKFHKTDHAKIATAVFFIMFAGVGVLFLFASHAASAVPTVTITSPSSNSEIYGKAINVEATATANDGGSIVSSALQVNGVTVSTLTSSPYSFSLNTLSYPDGSYTLSVNSTDDQGNVGSASVAVNISNGDLNLDGAVNVSDLAIMASNWGKTGQTYAQGAINGPGTVNIQDLAILAANWGWKETGAALAPGYFVSPTGSDSNAGTLQSPFGTIAKCQTAMQSSSTKTCYLRGGTYHPANDGPGCDANGTGSSGVDLQSADTGETFSYYPPDGYDSAIIDGGSTGSGTGLDVGICISANNVTINGLQIQNFQNELIYVLFADNATIENNVVHGTYIQPFVAAIKLNGESPGAKVIHNVVYDVVSNGISAHSCNTGYNNCIQGISNDFIAYNVVYNYCEDDYDCGAIEFQDFGPNTTAGSSTNVLAEYNYVRDGDLVGPGGPVNDGGGIGGGRALYLDDGTSNVSYIGNIVTGKNYLCLQVHGGSNDTYKNNICDIQPPASNQNVGNSGESIVYSQNSPQVPAGGMTNNVEENNIIISSDSNGGLGWSGDNSAPNNPTVSDNAYYNYSGGKSGSCYADGVYYCGVSGTDSSPQSIGNLFNTCPSNGADSWSFLLNASSPALSSPVGFNQPANDNGIAWGLAGFWGPPGYVIPHSGNAPSYKPSC